MAKSGFEKVESVVGWKCAIRKSTGYRISVKKQMPAVKCVYHYTLNKDVQKLSKFALGLLIFMTNLNSN